MTMSSSASRSDSRNCWRDCSNSPKIAAWSCPSACNFATRARSCSKELGPFSAFWIRGSSGIVCPLIFPAETGSHVLIKMSQVNLHVNRLPSHRNLLSRGSHDMKRIGILTAGGDTPSLNATIHEAVLRAFQRKADAFGLIKGFSSLFNPRLPHVHLNPLFTPI